MTERPHGRTKYVVEKCRCDTCVIDNRLYTRWLNKQRAYGRPRYVDAEPAQQHVARLRAEGMGWKRVADLAGLNRSTLWKLVYGDLERFGRPSERIRQATADKVLAVHLELADGAYVPNVGVRRRLQALVATGWSMSKLAEQLGVLPTNFGPLVHGREQVTVATARSVHELYDQLWDQPPPESTHRDKIAASRARRYARDRGWALPMAWDDDALDDPDATPDVGEPSGDNSPLPPPEELRFLLSCGESTHAIASRFGVRENTVQQRLRRERAAS